jgi:hypothetical protein
MSYNITGTKNFGGVVVKYLVPAPDFDSALLRFGTNDDGEFVAIALTKELSSCGETSRIVKDFNVLVHIEPPTATSDGVIVIDYLEYKKATFEDEVICKWNLQGFAHG